MNTRLTLDVSLMKKRRRWLRESTPKKVCFLRAPCGHSHAVHGDGATEPTVTR